MTTLPKLANQWNVGLDALRELVRRDPELRRFGARALGWALIRIGLIETGRCDFPRLLLAQSQQDANPYQSPLGWLNTRPPDGGSK